MHHNSNNSDNNNHGNYRPLLKTNANPRGNELFEIGASPDEDELEERDTFENEVRRHDFGKMRSIEVDEDEANASDHQNNTKCKRILDGTKIAILIGVWLLFTAFLMTTTEQIEELKLVSVPTEGKAFLVDSANLQRLALKLRAPFRMQGNDLSPGNQSLPRLTVLIERRYFNASGDEIYRENASSLWALSIAYPEQLDSTKETEQTHNYAILASDEEWLAESNYTKLLLKFMTNINVEFPLQLAIDESPIDQQKGIIYAAIVLLGLYILIIWEIVNRTLAAIIASTLSIGILAALDARPSMITIMSWIDVETLSLLFGMMILVAILSETGLFDFLAVYCYKITNGKVWPLVYCLCIFTAVLAAFLDNVTTLLLMTPVTIRLCEVMALNPVPILTAMVIYSNIGGCLTPVGDPPNVIIASNSYISSNGVHFANFTWHMFPVILLVMIQTYIQLRLKFRKVSDLKFKDSPEVEKLRHALHVWKRTASSLSAYSKDEVVVQETLMKKVNEVKSNLKRQLSYTADARMNRKSEYEETLEHLQEKYPIRNKTLLIKCSIALTFVIALFFLHSVPNFHRLSLGWTALLGAILLLILADIEDMEAILARVEWSTLLFFAALFILMEALSEMGLIAWIGNMTENMILGVGEESRLMVALLIILWVSAMASAFVDNIPLTTMMVKIIVSLAQNSTLNLPLQPLVWALALGACLGGNGTLIGASANVVCAGIAEQHGYKFKFLDFFKIGFPVMIGSIVVSTAYLLICHCVFAWH